MERVRGRLGAAFAMLEGELAKAACAATSDSITQAGVTVAVTWEFAHAVMPEVAVAAAFLAPFAPSAAAESASGVSCSAVGFTGSGTASQ